ncbi:unnamed protein product [Paramecium primaurelia]|uniref:Uncharacterized protein n=2 Tax=Paramecium TaxID=5884 RepID=A0A8S1UGW5_9CILI|nr:unnamed protein product [Paramecium primaurelia]CAD8162999.1 unnamed protein product [Paramecium pentaurelia]
MLSKPNNQDSNYSTVEIKQGIKRSVKEISNYAEIKASKEQFKATKIKQKSYIRLKQQNRVYAFPCYNDNIITHQKGENQLLRPRNQDDDNESDDEIIFQSLRFSLNTLVEALQNENKRNYSFAQFISNDLLNSLNE